MKKVVIFFDCHGQEIYTYMTKSPGYNKLFQVEFVTINEYVKLKGKYFGAPNLTPEHHTSISNADILILQVIERNRGYLNNSNIASLCSSECTVIKIPHYRNSIYNYKILEGFEDKYTMIANWSLPNKILDICDKERTREIIQSEIDNMNNHPYDKLELAAIKECKINEFSKIDNLSDIAMLDYYRENYQKYRLFQGRRYPSSIFFYELTNRILSHIDMPLNTDYVDLYFAENTSEPIPDYWYRFCNFTFNNTNYVKGHIEVTELEWYHMVLLSGDIDITNVVKNINLLNRVR
jgi:hypothetical protein